MNKKIVTKPKVKLLRMTEEDFREHLDDSYRKGVFDGNKAATDKAIKENNADARKAQVELMKAVAQLMSGVAQTFDCGPR